MEKKITSTTSHFLWAILFWYCGQIVCYSQTLITSQGFDSSAADTWNYTSSINMGTIGTNTSRFVSTPNSLRFGGSNSSIVGLLFNDPTISFTNTNISAYTNVKVTLHFSCDGTPDDSDDFYLDVSYNNGLTYTSTKLIDGKNDTSDNLAFSHSVAAGITVGSSYTLNIPNGNTQVLVRIRFDERDNQSNTGDYYFIDNVSLSGTPIGSFINVTGTNNNVVSYNSSAITTNGTDFGTTQIGATPIIKTFTIKNIGSNTINLSGSPTVQISGSSAFSVSSFPSSTINSEASTTFQITFNPITLGVKTATVSISSNADTNNPYLFEIKGEGIQTFFDSDDDAVFDNIDIDDDNDCIQDATEESNCNLMNGPKVNYKFLHETFGTGARTTINTTYNAITTYCYEDGTAGINTPECPNLSTVDLNDGKYTVGSSAQIASWAAAYWHLGGDHTGDPNGRMAIFNASYTPGIFYTATISGALPNIPITYSFWVLNLDRTDAPGIATRLRPDVRVEFRDMNDGLITFIETGDITPTTAGNLAGDWQHFTADLVLNVSAFKVIFINNETGGTGNDLALDDILISQTLCDLDSDGVADVFDLDSDNDGLPDIVEVGLGNLSEGKAYVVNWVDANSNGMHDIAESQLVPDTDGDGVPNYLDLDSDNDSIFDVDESWAENINAYVGYENGDGDIDGDGTGDGPESETFRNKDTNADGNLEGFGDGILDIYDYNFNVYGNLDQGTTIAPFLNYVIDTNGDGFPDYIDLKSNGSNFDILPTLYANLDTNSDGIIDGTADNDKDGIIDNFDTNDNQFGSPRDLERKLFLSFDGRNDYGADVSLLGGWQNASLMVWININSLFNSEGVVVGQDKLKLVIDSAKKLKVIANGTVLQYDNFLSDSQWIHVAAVYDGTNGFLHLYVNGEKIKSTSISGAINADASLFTIGKNPISNSQYFKGKIDEIRLFNIALSDAQLQKMIYQEIGNNAGQVRGLIIPKDIPSLPWANLIRYFKMDNYKDDIIDNHTTATIDTAIGATIYNVKTIKYQEAPMPFITEQTGDFPTAVHSTIKEIRGIDAEEYDWSIIHAKHNITTTSNNIDLGLLIDPNITIIMQGDSKLQNDWYLKLDGKIDLQGRSQLLQTTDSDLDPSSIGILERDQQGTGNKFNYNYWSSPVSSIVSTTENNTGFTIANVLKDGTNPNNPQPIAWINGYDGSSNPLRLAKFWLNKFTNLTPIYANWQQINENSTLLVGQGFTMKGSGIAIAPAIVPQNYVFSGKPNNGVINHAGIQIAPNNILLTGNPYPSALDANDFILDNLGYITGTLYFWEHYPSNNTHVLAGYQGGYGARNLVGGIAPIAPALISGTGSSSRIPGREIPVAQGYIIKGNNTGGQITFQNSQRDFVKENEVDSNIMFKGTIKENKSENTITSQSTGFATVRLGYTGCTNMHRQLLLGFMNQYADDNYNPGYDGEILDPQPNDIYFPLGNINLIIQGVGYFNNTNIYPLTVISNQTGLVKFMIDNLENFDPNQPIYIHDNLTDSYYDIRTNLLEITIPAGVIASRFSLRFYNPTLSTDLNTIDDQLTVYYDNETQEIKINNSLNNEIINEVSLFSILGQKIETWKIVNQNQQQITIKTKGLSKGIYIVQANSIDSKHFSKKIIIK